MGARFEIDVETEDEAVLEAEAERLGITVEQLAAHAVLVYLAELEFLGVERRAGTEIGPEPVDCSSC